MTCVTNRIGWGRKMPSTVASSCHHLCWSPGGARSEARGGTFILREVPFDAVHLFTVAFLCAGYGRDSGVNKTSS